MPLSGGIIVVSAAGDGKEGVLKDLRAGSGASLVTAGLHELTRC